jgi:hypothetical protein
VVLPGILADYIGICFVGEDESISVAYVAIHSVIVPHVNKVGLPEDSDSPIEFISTKTNEVNTHAKAMNGTFKISAIAQILFKRSW